MTPRKTPVTLDTSRFLKNIFTANLTNPFPFFRSTEIKCKFVPRMTIMKVFLQTRCFQTPVPKRIRETIQNFLFHYPSFSSEHITGCTTFSAHPCQHHDFLMIKKTYHGKVLQKNKIDRYCLSNI